MMRAKHLLGHHDPIIFNRERDNLRFVIISQRLNLSIIGQTKPALKCYLVALLGGEVGCGHEFRDRVSVGIIFSDVVSVGIMFRARFSIRFKQGWPEG